MLIASLMSITCGYHRLFAHQSYEASKWLEFLFLFFCAGAFQESCLKWSSDHRVHHQFVDQEKDPYNAKKGFFWSHIGWILIKQKYISPNPKDLLQNNLVMWQHKYWTLIAILSGFGLPTLVGLIFNNPLGGLFFGGIFRLFVGHHITFSINSFAHLLGSQPYSKSSTARDSSITALLTFGEGYHNFHHWYARDYRNGIKFYHFDPSKWFIKFMSYFKQTWNLKMVQEETLLRAKILMHKNKLEMNPKLAHAKVIINEFYLNLLKQIDELKIKKETWIEMKKNKGTQDWIDFKYSFQKARDDFKRKYKMFKSLKRYSPNVLERLLKTSA